MIICDCPIATHEHGDYLMYVIHKCRCAPCSEAKQEYQAAYKHLSRIGKFTGGRMPVEPVQERIQELLDDGISMKYLASQVGIDKSHVERIYHGVLAFTPRPGGNESLKRKSVSPENYKKIMGYRPPAYLDREDFQRIPAAGTARRLQALMRLGWPVSYIAEELGVSSSRVAGIMRAEKVQAGTARKVRDIYEAHWDQVPEPVARFDKQAVTKTIRTAERRGYQPPMFWDDDRIDDPTYTPVVPEIGDRRAVKRELFIQEVEHLASTGERLEAIAQRFDMSPGAVEKRLCRYGRADLAKRIGWEREEAA